MVGHLIVDATDAKLGPAIAKIRKDGIKLNVNLLGEAVLGEHEASRRLEGTHTLLARPDVDYVSIKVSSTVAPHSAWAFDEAVEHVVEKLTPLFTRAASFAGAGQKAKFINLDMEEYKDLDMTIAVFTRILDKPEFKNLEAGIVLQAYLPDALVRHDPPAGLGRRPPRRRRRRHQGPRRQGRQPAHGTGRSLPARLAAGHLGHQAGLGHQLQARHQLLAAPGPDQERPDRRRRPQPLRHRLRLAARQAARRGVRHRVRDAARHGPGPGRSRQEGRRLAPALHPGGPPGRVRRRHRLPDPPPRRGRQPGQLHVRRLRAQRKRSPLRAREAALPRLPGQARRRGPAAEPPAEPQPPGRAAAARLVREHPGHRPVAARQP